MDETVHYPFATIVGQENMQLALLLNVMNPLPGGVLIRGEKGTALRSLVEIFDQVEVVNGCRFHCRINGPYCEECEKFEKCLNK